MRFASSGGFRQFWVVVFQEKLLRWNSLFLGQLSNATGSGKSNTGRRIHLREIGCKTNLVIPGFEVDLVLPTKSVAFTNSAIKFSLIKYLLLVGPVKMGSELCL